MSVVAPTRTLAPACASCRHFDDAPQTLEAEIAGLAVMSSGYASVRSGDGLCRLHARYLSARAHCTRFAERSFAAD